MKNEVWKPVDGFPNTEVSNLGRVKSLFRGQDRIRKTQAHQCGYEVVKLQCGNFRKWCRVHVLVMEAFIGPKPKGWDVNHIDGCKQNNRLENLEYVTRSYNHKHAFQLGLAKSPFRHYQGSKHPGSKVKESDVHTMREMFAQGIPRRSIAEKFDISPYTVWDIVKRRSWKHVD